MDSIAAVFFGNGDNIFLILVGFNISASLGRDDNDDDDDHGNDDDDNFGGF